MSTGASNLQKALKKGTITLDGVGFPFKTSSATSVNGGPCGSEAGFQISGSVKNKAYAYTSYSLLVCLGGDTGTGTTGAFLNDITTAIANLRSDHRLGDDRPGEQRAEGQLTKRSTPYAPGHPGVAVRTEGGASAPPSVASRSGRRATGSAGRPWGPSDPPPLRPLRSVA